MQPTDYALVPYKKYVLAVIAEQSEADLEFAKPETLSMRIDDMLAESFNKHAGSAYEFECLIGSTAEFVAKQFSVWKPVTLGQLANVMNDIANQTNAPVLVSRDGHEKKEILMCYKGRPVIEIMRGQKILEVAAPENQLA